MAVDLSTLEHQEQRYRDRLIDDPTNADARLDLAWCLFLRAVCTVVREEAPKFASDSSVPRARQTGERRLEDARALLIGGLREAIKVCQLSSDPAHHVDAARLEFLVGLIGEQAIINLAHNQVDASLKRLAADVAADGTGPAISRDPHAGRDISSGNRPGRRPSTPAPSGGHRV